MNLRSIFLLGCVILLSLSTSAQQISPCSTDDMDEQYRLTHPQEVPAIDAAKATLNKAAKQLESNGMRNKTGKVYRIPIVFHILHKNGVENISDEQIYDAVRVINEDFRKMNADTTDIVSDFRDIAADCEIEVVLPQIDPDGNCTNGIDRIFTDETNAGTNASKLNQWPRHKYLNIWIVKAISSGAAGYAYYPFSTVNNPAIDGIVVLNSYVGSIGTSDYGRSRTLTHEIGHYLNLAHPWGSTNNPGLQSNCNSDDGVSDTPNTIGWQTCGLGGTTCDNNKDNVQNYMEYSYCSRMFTLGQKARMIATLESNIAGRSNLHSEANLIATGVMGPDILCEAKFRADHQFICEQDTIRYFDLSYNNPSGRLWHLPGGQPERPSGDQVEAVYAQPGLYDVTINVFNTTQSISNTQSDFIRVFPRTADYNVATYDENFEDAGRISNEWYLMENVFGDTWELASTGYLSSNALYVNNFDQTVREVSFEAWSPSFNLTNLDAPKVRFDIAYAGKQGNEEDEIALLASVDCGKSWEVIFSSLARFLVPPTVMPNAPFSPDSSQYWRSYTLPIPAVVHGENVRFKWEFTTGGGNNLYIDNFNVQGTAVGIEELSVVRQTVKVVPNPMRATSVLSFTLDKSTQVTIDIFDIQGRNVKRIAESQVLAAGAHQFALEASELGSGMFYASIQFNDQKVVQKFIVNP